MIKPPSPELLEHIKKYYLPLPKTGEVYSRKVKCNVGFQRIREGGYMRSDAKPARIFTLVDIRRRKCVRAHVIWYLCMGYWPTLPVIHINGDYTDDRLDNLRHGTVRGDTYAYLHRQMEKIEAGLSNLEQEARALAPGR